MRGTVLRVGKAMGLPAVGVQVIPHTCTPTPLGGGAPRSAGSRLSPYCLQKFSEFLDQGSAAHGWDQYQVWTGARVATLIGRKFHVSYGVSGATRLMRRLGFTPQMPARRVAERDEQALAVGKEATWTEVKRAGEPKRARAACAGWICFEDEADFTRRPPRG